MVIRQLQTKDAKQFSKLMINMYEHLHNLEWFTPMPYDIKNVVGMIENPRFYIVGAFIRNKLIGVSSLDYKCGKLIGKIDLQNLANQDFFSPEGKANLDISLQKFPNAEEIIVDYNILVNLYRKLLNYQIQ